MKFSTYVATGYLPADHPDRDQQFKLAKVVVALPHDAGLAYCTGCEWFVRRPARLGDLGQIAYQHLTSAHFDDLVAGRASLDPDLVDGGTAHLAARMEAVPRRLRHAFREAS